MDAAVALPPPSAQPTTAVEIESDQPSNQVEMPTQSIDEVLEAVLAQKKPPPPPPEQPQAAETPAPIPPLEDPPAEAPRTVSSTPAETEPPSEQKPAEPEVTHSAPATRKVILPANDRNGAPTLEGLPAELQIEICMKLMNPADLRNVCLVSSKMHAAATVALYRDVTIDVTDRDASRMTALMLTRENKGIDYIRGLNLIYRSVEQRAEDDKNDDSLLYALEVAMYVVNGMPKDKLHSFTWRSATHLGLNLLVLLFKRQRNLRHLDIGPIAHENEKTLLDFLKEDNRLRHCAANVTSFCIQPDCLNCLVGTQLLMREAKPITRLALSAKQMDKSYPPAVADDGQVSDPVYKAAFIWVERMKDQPMNLVELALEKVDLTYCKRTYTMAINFVKLKKLRITDCVRPDLLLDSLLFPTVGHPAHIHELSITHTETAGERFVTPAIDKFLGSFKGLQRLHMRIVSDGVLPSIGTIIRHGDTLESLYISMWEYMGKYHSWVKNDDWSRLLKGLPKVKDLAMPFHDLPQALNPDVDSEFKTIVLANFHHLKSLVTLNVLNWPKVQVANLNLQPSTYGVLLQHLATNIFRWINANPSGKPQKLTAVVFGEVDDLATYASHLTGVANAADIKRLFFVKEKGKVSFEESGEDPVAVCAIKDDLDDLGLPMGVINCDFKFEMEPIFGSG